MSKELTDAIVGMRELVKSVERGTGDVGVRLHERCQLSEAVDDPSLVRRGKFDEEVAGKEPELPLARGHRRKRRHTLSAQVVDRGRLEARQGLGGVPAIPHAAFPSARSATPGTLGEPARKS